MIEGFEDETAYLSDYEKDTLLPVIVRGLNWRMGIECVITNAEMVKALKKYGFKTTGARIRKIINYIRVKKLVINLISSSKGYYRTNDPEEVRKYVHSLMQRASAIEKVAKSFEL